MEWFKDNKARDKIIKEIENTVSVDDEKEDYYIKTNFNTSDEFSSFINKVKSRSVKKFGIEVDENDKIMTISTCANNNNYRVVLHAKMIDKYNRSIEI